MREVGPFLDAEAPIEIDFRSGVTVVRVRGGAVVAHRAAVWEWIGTTSIRTPVVADEWIWAHLPPGISEDPGTGYAEFLLVVEDGPWTSARRVRQVAAVDVDGRLFVAPFTERGPVEAFTGELLDVSHLRPTAPLGDPSTGEGGPPTTGCLYADACSANYEGATLHAPVDGELRCTTDGFELRADTFALDFSGAFSPCPAGTTTRVSSGDLLVLEPVSRSVTVGYVDLWIRATDLAGKPIDVAIDADARLYVGEITPTVECPCLPGH